MKRPTMLVEAVLRQAEMDLDLSVERDIAVMRHRCEHEGFSFLTITLASLSDALERGLETGTFTCPTSFSRHGRLPRFLGGFFKRVFDKDGRLLPTSCPECVFYIRQICRFMKKLKISCSPKREAKATQQFKVIEGELYRATPSVIREDSVLDKISGIIWSQVFPEIDYLDLVCRHGPGVTAERRLANERFEIRFWNDRSEHTFPSDLHCFPNYGLAGMAGGYRECTDSIEGPTHLALPEEHPVRVVFVPKTQSAPRVIAIEPSHMQYMQQALKDYSYRVLESHVLTRQSIRFIRQEPNQRLAYSSSIDKRLATLDLKDASDRVHLALVQRIFKTSGILEYLEDSRSLSATLPDGCNIVLNKFASMGSAMCFPVEAMVFYTLIQSAMHQLDGRRPSSRSIQEYSRMIDIYGDDIIVPVEYADTVVSYLESYALKVNVSKSFKEGNFRESCGADYFKGVAVNPVYARRVPHDDSRHWGAEEVMAWNATADLFYLRGMWHVAQVIHDLLRSVAKVTIPRTRELGSGLAFISLLYTTDLRWNADLQCFKQKRLVYQPTKRKDDVDGNELACLNKWGIGNSTPVSVEQPKDLYGDYALRRDLLRRIKGGGTIWTDGRDSERGAGSDDPAVDPRFSGCCICSVSGPEDDAERNDCSVSDLGAVCASGCSRPAESAIRSSELPHWGDYDFLRSLDYLQGRTEGLDFSASVKRGGFKSKRRWVSLAS